MRLKPQANTVPHEPVLWFAEKIDHPSATFHTFYNRYDILAYIVACLLLISIHARKRAQCILKMRFSWDGRVEHTAYICCRYAMSSADAFNVCCMCDILWTDVRTIICCALIWCDVSNLPGICYGSEIFGADVCNMCGRYGMSSADV